MKNNFSILEYKYIYPHKRDLYQIDHLKNLQVPRKVFDELKCFILKNSEQSIFLKPAYKKGIGEVLQAQNYVGVMQTKDGTTIEILPKVQNVDAETSKKILIKMLKTLKNQPFKNFNVADLKSSKMPLFEIFITMFLEELANLIKKGIQSDYMLKPENLYFLKGKLQIKEQIKKNYIHKEKFFVEYDEFSMDRLENRIIKSTLKLLQKKSRSNRNRQKIKEFLLLFDQVSVSTQIQSDLSKVKKNRQMKEYQTILLLSKLFLLNRSMSPYQGDDLAFALLFDMNLLFESYVGYYFKKRCVNISLQMKEKFLIEEPKKFGLKPDIVIYDAEDLLIADTKWKVIQNEKDISQSDMYQLYAYGTKFTKCSELYLIYPYDQHELALKYIYQKKDSRVLALYVLFFDLISDRLLFYPQETEKETRLIHLIQ